MTKSATEKPSRMEKRVEALFIKLIVLIFLMIKGKIFFGRYRLYDIYFVILKRTSLKEQLLFFKLVRLGHILIFIVKNPNQFIKLRRHLATPTPLLVNVFYEQHQ